MRKVVRAIPLIILAAACGRSDEDVLHDAANQSDPAAAAVLNEAADEGIDPQVALEAAGQAQVANVTNDSAPPSGSLQAKPNLPNDPNRPTGGEPLEKVSTINTAAAPNAAGHNME